MSDRYPQVHVRKRLVRCSLAAEVTEVVPKEHKRCLRYRIDADRDTGQVEAETKQLTVIRPDDVAIESRAEQGPIVQAAVVARSEVETGLYGQTGGRRASPLPSVWFRLASTKYRGRNAREMCRNCTLSVNRGGLDTPTYAFAASHF